MSRNEIVTETDLVTAVEDALKRRGVFEKLKAKIRAEVFHVLDDKDVPVARTDRDLPPDLFLARELVKEFLMVMRLENTLSVFNEEMGQGMEMSVDRAFLGSELGLSTAGCDERIPLLVLIAQFLKKNREDFLQNMQMPSTRSERDTRIDLASEHTDNENYNRRQTAKSGNSSISSRSNSSLSPASSRSGRQNQQTERSPHDEKLTVLVEERGETDSQRDEDDDSEAPLSLPTLPVYSRNTEANRDASMAEPDYSYSFYAESEA